MDDNREENRNDLGMEHFPASPESSADQDTTAGHIYGEKE